MTVSKKLGILLLVLVLCASIFPVMSLKAPVLATSDTPSWVPDPGNPVDGDLGLLAGEASVIYDAAAPTAEKYKMWYTRASSDSTPLGQMIERLLLDNPESTLGTNMDQLVAKLKAGSLSAIPDDHYDEINAMIARLAITDDTSEYYIDIEEVLKSASPTIEYATSPDGKTWTPQGTVLTPGSTWDAYGVSSPSVILDGGTYKMWYTGWHSNPGAIRDLFIHMNDLINEDTGLGEGITLTILAHLLIDHNPQDAYTALKAVNDGEYVNLFIEDLYAILESSGGDIGYASSGDGQAWTKQTGPVLTRGEDDGENTFDFYGAYSPSVVKVSTGYKMWYTGFAVDFNPLQALLDSEDITLDSCKAAAADMLKVQICLASSEDGLSWTKDAANPVMGTGFGITPTPTTTHASLARVTIGIINQEHSLTTYTLHLQIDGAPSPIYLMSKQGEDNPSLKGENNPSLRGSSYLPKQSQMNSAPSEPFLTLTLNHEEKWEQTIAFAPTHPGENQKVEFLLYKIAAHNSDSEGSTPNASSPAGASPGEASPEPYNSLHLWIDAR